MKKSGALDFCCFGVELIQEAAISGSEEAAVNNLFGSYAHKDNFIQCHSNDGGVMTMQLEPPKQDSTYDVFLCYSRRDIKFVKLLEKALNDYVPSAGRHRPSVFLDEVKITGNEYYRSIERSLRQSRKLILVASPNAYKSQFVNDEVRDFIRMKGARNVFVLLLDGLPNNEVQPGQESLKAFPEVLCEVMRMPLAADYRGFEMAQADLTTGRYQNEWRRLLEHIYDEDLVPTAKEAWDIFISYAPADAAFAGHLEKELEKYAPPKDLALEHNLPFRRLKVFRDEDDATRDDKEAIRRALESSKQMFLLCSPSARDDVQVRQQVAQFAGLQGAERIISVLVPGKPASDSTQGAFPTELCQWIKEPSYTDYRGFKLGKDKVSNGAYSSHWATLLATHYQVKREELEQRERKRRARNRQLIGGLAAAVILLLSAALAWALISRRAEAMQREKAESATREANRQRDVATQKQREADTANQQAQTERGKAEQSAIEANEQRNLAESQRAEAVRQKNAADEQRREAERQRGIADWASEDAKRAADIAEKRRKEAEEHRLMAEERLYVSNMLQAQDAYAQRNFPRVNDFLEASFPAPTAPKSEDMRSFDWFYLWRQVHNEKATLEGHLDAVLSVAFSSDGRTLASGSGDKTVKLWDVASGQEKATLTGHTSFVLSVAFSSDGRTLASGSDDKTVKLWDVASGRVKATLNEHTASGLSVAFSSDGRTLASGSLDRTIQLYFGAKDETVARQCIQCGRKPEKKNR